jgi:hypothetical protein
MRRPTAFALAGALAFASPLIIHATYGATLDSTSVFATGTAVGATGPDSVTIGDGSVWVSYANGASSTGGSGSSTIVQYSLTGAVQNTFSIAGSVDGLKVDPSTGLVWALQNQDGNSSFSFINPTTHVVSAPIFPSVASSSRGYDDVVFRGSNVFLSYTNPGTAGDPTIQQLTGGHSPANPFSATTVLSFGATGTNLATGQPGQATSQNDPDSLKLAPNGDLVLSSGDDGELIFVHDPAGAGQSVSFLQLTDATGTAVSGLDDSIIPTASAGEFFLADTGNNRVLELSVSRLTENDLFASVGSLHEFGLVDQSTGVVSPFLAGLNGPHGVDFLAAVPEPNTVALIAGVVVVLLRRRRRPIERLVSI